MNTFNKICYESDSSYRIHHVYGLCIGDIDCEIIAKVFRQSKYHISRKFKEITGVSLWEYVIKRRLLHFNDLIRKNHTIENACFESGFNNYSNFFRLYKKHFGISPTEFIKRL